MDDIQICVVIFFDPTVLERGGGIYTLHGFAIDGIDEPGGVLGVRTHEDGRLAVRACVAHPLASGVHLVELRVDLHDAGVIFHQWAIRVD
jgi:hypothetical protein